MTKTEALSQCLPEERKPSSLEDRPVSSRGAGSGSANLLPIVSLFHTKTQTAFCQINRILEYDILYF
jgi:hypothetical protein